jgi:hypothetical protein
MKGENMREKKLRNRGVSLLLVIAIIATTIIVPSSFKSATAATGSKIKLYNFIKLVVQATGVEVDTTYLEAALKAGIVKEGDFTDYSKYTTRTDAAVILNRADEYLNGDKVDPELLDLVLSSRISDTKKIDSDKREAVAKIYAKGFIKGYSNGYYIKSREFRGSEYMTISGAKGVVAMLTDTKKRAKLSPDGQLIRTTNLPKNASKYVYILETYPNSFYEMKFMYQRAKYYYEPKELIDYASPSRFKDVNFYSVDYKKYIDTWMKRVETNLNYRLNVDYRTIDSKWINILRSSYTQYGDSYSDKRITDVIKKYVDVVKKNKIVIKSQIISVEPSSLYMKGAGYYVRVYVKFKVSYNGSKMTSDDLISGGYVLLPGLKKDTWFDGVYDIELGTVNGSSNGSDYYVTDASLIDYDN